MRAKPTSSFKYTNNSENNGEKQPDYVIKKQLLYIWGEKIRVFNYHSELIALTHALPLKLKEKLKIYSDGARQHHIATVSAAKIFDFNATLTITEPNEKTILSTMQRKGLASELWRDQWLILDSKGSQLASLVEDNVKMGLIRRFALPFLPQTYHLLDSNGKSLLTIHQQWLPWLLRYKVYVTNKQRLTKLLPQKTLLAIFTTLATIEGRQ